MARLTQEFIRRRFLANFAAMSAERREGTIEALTVLHETMLPQHVEEEEEPEAAEDAASA